MTVEPIKDVLARVKAYVEAIPTLYDDDNPMHPELVLDTATNWVGIRDTAAHDLTYADLVALVEWMEALRQKTGNQLILWAETEAGLW
jgi:hypothetical protein